MTNSFTNARRVAEQFDPEEYHKPNAKRGDPALVMTRSSLMEFAACPLDWLNSEPTLGLAEDEEPEDPKESKSLKWGSLIDSMILDPARTGEQFAFQPAEYTNDKSEEKPWSNAAKVCKEWNADHGEGKTLIPYSMQADSTKAIARLKKDVIAWEYLEASKKQVLCTADYADPETGLVIPFKILIDLEPDAGHKLFGRSLGDFKTARDLTPKKWSRDVFEYDYYVQAKLYLDVYNSAMANLRQPATPRDEFKHVIQSNKAPYGVARRWIDEGFMQLGHDAYTAALKRYARCLKTGVWPGIDDEDDNQGVIVNGWRQTSGQPWMIKP